MPSKPYSGTIAKLPRETVPDWHLSRTAIRTDHSLVVVNFLEPIEGWIPPYHDHPFDQLTMIFAGEAEFDIDGTKYPLSAGDFLYVPAGRPHRGITIGNDIVLNVDVFAPARADYRHLGAHQPD